MLWISMALVSYKYILLFFDTSDFNDNKSLLWTNAFKIFAAEKLR